LSSTVGQTPPVRLLSTDQYCSLPPAKHFINRLTAYASSQPAA